MESARRVLEQATRTLAERGESYGPARALFEQVAGRWTLTLGVDVSAEQVVLCLLDLKQARLAHDPTHTDSMVDVAGYAAVLAQVVRTGQ